MFYDATRGICLCMDSLKSLTQYECVRGTIFELHGNRKKYFFPRNICCIHSLCTIMGVITISVPKRSQRVRLARVQRDTFGDTDYEAPIIDAEEEARLEEERYKQQVMESDLKAAYERGVQDGRDVSAGMYEHELRQHQEWLRNFDSVAANLQEDYSSAVHEMEDAVIKLSALLAEQILQYEAEQNTHIVVEQARKAFRRLQGIDHVEVHVHPDNIEALTIAKSSLLNDTRTVRSMNIVADVTVERGGCVLYTRLGMIDARLTTQLGNLLEQMLSTREEHRQEQRHTSQEDTNRDEQFVQEFGQMPSDDIGAAFYDTMRETREEVQDIQQDNFTASADTSFMFDDIDSAISNTDHSSLDAPEDDMPDDSMSWLFDDSTPQ